ncbi:MAG: type V CRISPR-associated endonuclease Cas1 [Nanoarchaeota archaeon]|nr:type V CRISPR-associated endonuclease Cas1 [Nanoarchaeota archaeon]
MMSRPDFMSKQLLFIDSDSSKKIKFRNSNLVVVDENNKTILQHSCHKIFLVFIYGEFSITSVLIKQAKRFSFPIIFLNFNLKMYYSVIPENKGNFLLRKKQYLDLNKLEISKFLISNKAENQLYLMKSLRYKTTQEKICIDKMKFLISQINNCSSNQEMLGIEGNASKLFFKVYFKNLDFRGRRPRAKEDIFNLLLDIGYHYLFNFIEANLELYGFDTYYGVHHTLFYQRKSLVCDVIEPFRCIIDRKIRKGFNLKQIDRNDFYEKNGQYFIKKECNKKYSQFFLKEILSFKEEIFLFIQSYYRNFIKENDISKYSKFTLEEKK